MWLIIYTILYIVVYLMTRFYFSGILEERWTCQMRLDALFTSLFAPVTLVIILFFVMVWYIENNKDEPANWSGVKDE